MTKGGVTLFAKSAALEFARWDTPSGSTQRTPARSTLIWATRYWSRARNIGTNDIEAARRRVIELLPIRRMGTPNDIAKGIVFLAP
jgi:NAD(P)-dependent dehydrogenase (short-subunit alcohol dehydrogenase family)